MILLVYAFNDMYTFLIFYGYPDKSIVDIFSYICIHCTLPLSFHLLLFLNCAIHVNVVVCQ